MGTKKKQINKVEQRIRLVLSEVLGDLDEANCSAAQRQLARRAAALTVICEGLEPAAANGQVDAVEPYLRATETLRRVLSTLGLERRQKQNVASLADYLAAKYGDREGS